MNKLSILLVGFFLIGFVSCSEDFLEADTDRYLTEERIEDLREDPASAELLVDAALSGVYATLVDNGFNGNTAHDYFGLKSIHLATDLTSLDMVQAKHHWFGFDYNFDNRFENYRRTRLMWAMFYKVIASSNIVLDTYLPENPTEPDIQALKAKTLGLRGMAYYYLVNLYQQTYVGNESALGVPISLSASETEPKPRALVKEVYDVIISDLTYAVKYGESTVDKKDVDKRVAATFLAKTFAHQEKWDSVAYYAQIAIEGASLMSASTYLKGLGDISNPEWLWGYDINAQTTTLYASFYSHIDNQIDGYAGALGVKKNIFSGLYDQIHPDDVRSKLFIDSVRHPEIAQKWFPGQSAEATKYINIKYQTPQDFSGDYCFVRVADAYLLLAEAQVELNDLAGARNTLEAIIQTRYNGYSSAAFVSQDDLREEVRLQRRIELWGEGALFFDYKRWKMPVYRDVSGSNHRVKKNIEAGAIDFVYQIPVGEIESNSLLEQNP